MCCRSRCYRSSLKDLNQGRWVARTVRSLICLTDGKLGNIPPTAEGTHAFISAAPKAHLIQADLLKCDLHFCSAAPEGRIAAPSGLHVCKCFLLRHDKKCSSCYTSPMNVVVPAHARCVTLNGPYTRVTVQRTKKQGKYYITSTSMSLLLYSASTSSINPTRCIA